MNDGAGAGDTGVHLSLREMSAKNDNAMINSVKAVHLK